MSMNTLRCLLALVLSACLSDASALQPLPEIDDSGFEAGVRSAMQERLAGLEARLADPQADDTESAAVWGELGQFLHAQKLEAVALVAYANAAQLDAQAARWAYLAAVIDSDAGRWEAAVVGMNRSLELEPGYWPALVRLGRAYLSMDQLDDARRAFRRALARRPDDATVHMGLGEIALAEQDYQAAARHLRLALAAQPQADRLNYQLGIALRNLGDVEGARAALSQRGDQVPMMEDPWMVAVQAKNINSDRFYQRGSELAQAGNYRAAVAEFEQAVAMGPDEVGYRAALAQSLAAAEQPERALQVAEQALRRWPEDPELQFQMGIAQELLGDEAQARRWYQQTFSGPQPYPIAGIRLAHSHLREGQYSEAIGVYRQVLDNYGESPDARFWMAMAQMASGDCGSALDNLKQVIAVNPSDARVANALARVFATCPAASGEDRRQALGAAQALVSFRSDATHTTTLAMALAAQGQFESAVERQLQAISVVLNNDPHGRLPWYRELLEGFEQQRPASQAWPSGDAALKPPLTFARG